MFKRVLLIVTIFLCGINALMAQDDEPIYGLVSVDNASVRVGPDFAYDAVGQLPLNASVVVVGRAGDFYASWNGMQWVQIQFGDRLAWIYARLLRTSLAFNSIPPTGRILPRDRNGRVPDEFDLSSEVCSQWAGSFGRSGDFMAGDQTISVTYPGLQGANLYRVVVISPTGFRIAFDYDNTSATLELEKLPAEPGTYTWRVAPYWSVDDYFDQQVCLLQTGGTFDKPET